MAAVIIENKKKPKYPVKNPARRERSERQKAQL
jgi:hypothetical protein